VSLLEEGQLSQLQPDGGAPPSPPHSLLGEDELAPAGEQPPTVGRITIHCTANSYDLVGLQAHLEESGHTWVARRAQALRRASAGCRVCVLAPVKPVPHRDPLPAAAPCFPRCCTRGT
jgi:hypothetical protein